MLCSFKFDLPVDPTALIELVKQKIEENGGSVTGRSPNISMVMATPLGAVEGICKLVKGSVVNVIVEKMPEFVSCNAVREKLVYYITEAVKLYVAQSKAGSQAKGGVAA